MTWGNLDDSAREALRTRAVDQLSEGQLDERISRDAEGRVRFRLFGPDRDEGIFAPLERGAQGPPPPPSEVTLIPPEEFDYDPDVGAEDRAAAAPIDAELEALQDVFTRDRGLDEGESAGLDGTLPAVVDRTGLQSPIKNQANRGTCVAHASLACLEAFPAVPEDLSEQYAHFKFNEIMGRRQDEDAGIQTTEAARLLSRSDGRVCIEPAWRYITDQPLINAAVAAGTYRPPPAAVENANFGYVAYKLIVDNGLDGESIKNTAFLESVLATGMNIVCGTWVSWPDEDNGAILRPILDSNGQPVGRGGHAMLMVGYDRNDQFFIMKNSWGTGWGHHGFGHFSYDYIRSCFKYGFTVQQVTPSGGMIDE